MMTVEYLHFVPVKYVINNVLGHVCLGVCGRYSSCMADRPVGFITFSACYLRRANDKLLK